MNRSRSLDNRNFITEKVQNVDPFNSAAPVSGQTRPPLAPVVEELDRDRPVDPTMFAKRNRRRQMHENSFQIGFDQN